MIRHGTLYSTVTKKGIMSSFSIYLQCETHGKTRIVKWTIDGQPVAQGVVLCDDAAPAMGKADALRVDVADNLGVEPSAIDFVFGLDL